ncbi:unnamed protein product [Prorocentrum cordatum]|uniref:Uncharacterized protein n=1 Tax=Prorocentrum cordatum TaxID=2364126 RepID=A0ABN9WHA3_9DINO|nr:unnamed protein product [Polarella glacialis]
MDAPRRAASAERRSDPRGCRRTRGDSSPGGPGGSADESTAQAPRGDQKWALVLHAGAGARSAWAPRAPSAFVSDEWARPELRRRPRVTMDEFLHAEQRARRRPAPLQRSSPHSARRGSRPAPGANDQSGTPLRGLSGTDREWLSRCPSPGGSGDDCSSHSGPRHRRARPDRRALTGRRQAGARGWPLDGVSPASPELGSQLRPQWGQRGASPEWPPGADSTPPRRPLRRQRGGSAEADEVLGTPCRPSRRSRSGRRWPPRAQGAVPEAAAVLEKRFARGCSERLF